MERGSTGPRQPKRARMDGTVVQQDRQARCQWAAVSAVCRQRRRRQAQESLHAAWDVLSDEAVWCILVMCAQRDICALAATCRRMHRLCMDDALWRHIYRRDFPPCHNACLLPLGDEVSRSALSPLDYARRRLDRLLDPGDDLSVPDLAPSQTALWTVERLTSAAIHGVSECVHHWPDVIAARGYRWACASMIPLESYRMPQRLFYPVNEPGAHGVLVGHCLVRSIQNCKLHDNGDIEEPNAWPYLASYRGDVEPGTRGFFVAHGFGTISDPTASNLLWACRSGAWSHGQGHISGPCALWQRAMERPDTVVFMHCSGRELVHHAEMPGQPDCGIGVLLSSDGDVAVGCLSHPKGDPREGTTRLALIAHAGQTDRCVGSITAMATCASLRRVTAHLCGVLPGDIDGQGLLRTPSQRVAFVGSLIKGEPLTGKTWDAGGRLLYAGSFKHNVLDHGTLYTADGTTLQGSWVRGWRDIDSPAYSIPAIHLTASHPDGATVLWKDWMRVDRRMRPRVADFWWTLTANGTVTTERPWPSADWDVLVLPHDPAQPTRAPVRPLLADVGLAVARSTHLLHADEIVDDLAFWPRPNPDDGPRPHLDDTLAFLSRMVATRPRWARCLCVVSAMYGPL
ncbi:F-box domain containing protein [Pandoravirus quercus]|uniref:F-box domain containing protein n=1 Tax=Pandoravirus quercus TaxID=2107709 RepID=A0A2U7UA44_9VIRU|nr:F-box domain containing protein [Pandoravirus quercus]AVK75313.1 F-box domain containing protein [Pandoravirus quercus]